MALAIVGAGGLAVVGAALIALIPARRLRDLGTAFVLAEDLASSEDGRGERRGRQSLESGSVRRFLQGLSTRAGI